MTVKIIKLFLNWSFLVIPLIYLGFSIVAHQGVKEGYGSYFITATFFSLLLVTFTTKNVKSHFIKSVVALLVMIVLTTLFWNYMDHPWFAGPETYSCDGRCFGWFSFENDSPGFLIVLFGSCFIFITGVVKSLIWFLLKNKKKS